MARGNGYKVPTKTRGEKTSPIPHSDLMGWLQFADEASRKKHWEFFVIDQMLRGNHNVRGNPNDNTIEITKKGDSVYYPINKIFSTFRAVRAFVTKNKPVINVEPANMSDEAKNYARRSNQILDRK